MKVDLTKVLTDLDGKPIKHEEKDMTLGRACVIALNTPLEEDRGSGPEKVADRWKLVMRLHNAPEAELTAEELVLIRNRVLKIIFTLAAAAQACELLKG